MPYESPKGLRFFAFLLWAIVSLLVAIAFWPTIELFVPRELKALYPLLTLVDY